MHLLGFFERRQQPARLGRVVTVALQIGEDAPLAGEVPFAFQYVALGQRQVSLESLPVHRVVVRPASAADKEARRWERAAGRVADWRLAGAVVPVVLI